MTSVGWGTAGCYGNNIPLSASPGSVSSPYVFPIPQEAFAYPLTIAASTNNPPTPPTLTCPASVNIGQNVSVTLRATDPNGDQVQYAVDWLGNASAGQNSGWTPLVASGVSQTLTKTGGYATAGSYTIYGWSRDQNGSLSTPSSCVVTVAAGNLPPTAPIITGPRTGTINTNYTYSFTSTDPEGDQILYSIDWDMNGSTDQGNPNGTPFNSGQPLTATHSWSTLGPQTFQARTYDVIGNVSGWTQYTVTISPPLPDLTAATGPGVVRVAGTPVTLTGTVTNSGSANANSFPNNFQVCDSKCSPFNDNVPAGTTTQLLPGQSGGLSMSYTVPSIVPSIVPLQYRICSNDNGSGGHVITESNYNNNCGA